MLPEVSTVVNETSPADHPAVGSAAMQGTLAITGDADADELLNTDPLALVLGMLLDQQVR
jgi:hypothetical protein